MRVEWLKENWGIDHPVTEQLLDPRREGMAASSSRGMLGTAGSPLVRKCELLGARPWGSALHALQHGSAMQNELPNQGFA